MADKKKSGGALDFGTLSGLVLALAAVVGGLVLEGGEVGDILQLTAALIVLGGTCGAVLVSTPSHVLAGGLRRLGGVIRDPSPSLSGLIDEIIGYSMQARKNGLVSLEDASNAVQDPFLKKGLTLAVDGSDLQEIRDTLVLELDVEEARTESEARVFESAGGYAPTIGIIGAVLGLIQVMKNLEDIAEVGHGIAVAFVATVYGVGCANLLFLPIANKIKARAHAEARRKELMIEGIAGIVEGLNPKLLRGKLEGYLEGPAPSKPDKAKADKKVSVAEPAPAPEKA